MAMESKVRFFYLVLWLSFKLVSLDFSRKEISIQNIIMLDGEKSEVKKMFST